MKCQTMGPILGKLVHQLPKVVTLAYDLCLMHTVPRYKDISKEYTFGMTKISPWTHVGPRFPIKLPLGP